MTYENADITTGIQAATYFKYFAQKYNPYINSKLPIDRIHAKSFYARNKTAFDNLIKVFSKFNIDIVKYISFFIDNVGKTDKDIQTHLIDISVISRYAEYLQIKRQYYTIYKNFMKSVNNIIDDCIKLDYTSTKEYFRYLISNDLLVNQYVSGRISCYYLCAIQNFKKLIPKMSVIAQHEFSKILLRYDKYNTDVNEAFKMYKSTKINPIRFTDELLWKKINEQK